MLLLFTNPLFHKSTALVSHVQSCSPYCTCLYIFRTNYLVNALIGHCTSLILVTTLALWDPDTCNNNGQHMLYPCELWILMFYIIYSEVYFPCVILVQQGSNAHWIRISHILSINFRLKMDSLHGPCTSHARVWWIMILTLTNLRY